jgi:hypothetical protein
VPVITQYITWPEHPEPVRKKAGDIVLVVDFKTFRNKKSGCDSLITFLIILSLLL